MSERFLQPRRQVIEAGLALQQNGLIARTWGNISARISDTRFVITPSGRAYDTLTPDDIVAVNIQDLSCEGNIRPSSERGMHAAIYAQRPDVSFIIHTHQNYASALSVLASPITGIAGMNPDAAGRLGDVVPCAAYGLNGSERLIQAVRKAVASQPGSHAVLMQNHGIVAFDTDYDHTLADALALEAVSEQRYRHLTGNLFPSTVAPGLRNMTTDYRHLPVSVGFDNGEPNVDHEGYQYNKIYRLSGHFGIPEDHSLYSIHSLWPFTRKVSDLAAEGTIPPFLDDCASDVGVNIRVLEQKPHQLETAAALYDRNAFLIRGSGAVCIAATESEVEAVQIVLEKNCIAALLSYAGVPTVSVANDNAEVDRENYLRNYSRLIDTNR